MRAPVYHTPVTEIFEIDHPILAGGLNWLSTSDYVASAVNAGCMAFITPRSYPSPEAFREDLGKCRELTGDKPFGVNLSFSSQAKNNLALRWQMDIAFDEGVRFFETVGNIKPTPLINALKEKGGIVLHKASSIRHALSAQSAGADLIGIVGHEEGGHPGNNDLSTLTLAVNARKKLDIPFVVGGGIGSGQQIVAMLAVGASGVVMGSRFLVAEESWAHADYKTKIASVDENCSVAVLSDAEVSGTWRVLKNDTTDEILRRTALGKRTYEDFSDLIAGTITRDEVYTGGDWRKGMISVGPAASHADRIEPMEVIIDQLIDEMGDAEAHLAQLHTRPKQSSPKSRMPA